jgi:hypothetical protein
MHLGSTLWRVSIAKQPKGLGGLLHLDHGELDLVKVVALCDKDQIASLLEFVRLWG